MGTEFVPRCVEDDNMEISPIPPGFESLVAPFTLKKKIEDNQVSSFSRSVSSSEAKDVLLGTKDGSSVNSKTITTLKRKGRMKHNQFDNSLGDEIESKEDMRLRSLLPKGVIRGCEECKNCQRVIAKWHPEESHRPNLEEAPVFYPSEEEFEDTLNYISTIRSKAETYGICRIVPPPSWKPPCPLKERDMWETSKFTSRIQRIDKLQNRESVRKLFKDNHDKKKRRRCHNEAGEVRHYEAENFGFEPGPEFTLDAFQKYADDFKAQYFRKNDNSSNSGGGNEPLRGEQWQPSVEDIEGEYWRIVEKPTEAIEVLYGADVETGAFGSGFPKTSQQVASDSDIKYINSGWNLNNFPRLPGSVLSYESSDISGVLVPWLYIGMCFSSFCWHVEDHHLYSLNYMHWGAPKLWYGVPGSDAVQLEAAMRKYLPDLFDEQPDLLHKLVTQLSPSILRSDEVPVYRCVQNPGEFVLTFPRAYHAGFNCGFNCAEAVNVAPVDWLPHGHNAVELYCQQGRQTSISHDKLLLGAAREAVKANWEYNLLRKYNSNNLRWKEVCGKDGILSTALKTRVEMEQVRRDLLCKSSHALKMESSFDASSERECCLCLFDLHLSAVGCHHCSPAKYACLSHAKQLCSCSWSAKFFLIRYDMDELKLLVEALEGKLSAVYRWARLHLGLALSSYVSKDKLQIPVPPSSQGLPLKEVSSLLKVDASKEQTKCNGSTRSLPNVNPPPVVVLALEKVDSSSKLKKVNSSKPGPRYRAPLCQDPQVNSLEIASSDNLGSGEFKGRQPLFPENKSVILLSDDDGDELSKETSGTSQKPARIIQKRVSDNTFNLDSSINNPASTTTTVNSVCIKVEDHAETGRFLGADQLSSSCIKSSLIDPDSFLLKKDTPEYVDCGTKPELDHNEKTKSEDTNKKLEAVDLRSVDSKPSVSNPTGLHINSLDRYYRQKGPRTAKVVRRIKCNVELLDFGAVHTGNLWCDSRAIYPKGFRSRVKYIDVINPANICFYVSEILDAGRDGPLFMVSVEHSPSEVFIHISASRCWEMVRERVNHEIAKQYKLERRNLPPFQPPGSLDGMEMFGFTSPAIMQEIQAMDKNRVCSEYWESRPLMWIPQRSEFADNGANSKLKSECERILNGLFKKADPEELHTLYNFLPKVTETDENSLLIRLLREEINKTQDRFRAS